MPKRNRNKATKNKGPKGAIKALAKDGRLGPKDVSFLAKNYPKIKASTIRDFLKRNDDVKSVGKIKKKIKKARSQTTGGGNDSGGDNSGGGNNSGLKIGGGNTVTVPKDDGKGWNPKRIANRVKTEWSDRFKNYKGPQRLKVKRGKLPARLKKYSQYKITGEGKNKKKVYKGFDEKSYIRDVRDGLTNRYLAKGGNVQDPKKIERMIKRDGPKADFKIKPKYSETMDQLRNQLGGEVKYNRTLGSVTQALGRSPEFRGEDLKNTGMSILKPRTTEDTAASYPSTIQTGPRETKNTPVNNRPKLYKKFPTIKRNKSKK